ncbi:MAG: hypothetical protein E6G60_06645 [Actinobacteria bacterium]|nr:MAG: hypothetical protein E6G60_06645 [Actinomycetota bacterium]
MREVTGVERGVARVGACGGPGAPQEEAADAPLVGDERDAKIGAEAAQLRRRLDPALGGNEVVALRKRRKQVAPSSTSFALRSQAVHAVKLTP